MPPDGWPHAHAQRHENHVDAERPAAFGGRERARNHRDIDGEDGGRTQALEAARGDERAKRGRGTAKRRAECEDRETGQEERLASQHVGQPSKGEQDGRDDDEIADQDPLDSARQRYAEGVCDRGQGRY